jgi:hypothetical protein
MGPCVVYETWNKDSAYSLQISNGQCCLGKQRLFIPKAAQTHKSSCEKISCLFKLLNQDIYIYIYVYR